MALGYPSSQIIRTTGENVFAFMSRIGRFSYTHSALLLLVGQQHLSEHQDD